MRTRDVRRRGLNRWTLHRPPAVRSTMLRGPPLQSHARDRASSGTATAHTIGSLALALALGQAPSALAAMVTVNSDRGADAIEVRASAVLDADAATAWRVLTDYDHYVDFIPDLRLSRVVARRGALVTVEQSGDATLWLLKVPIQVTFEVSETPPSGLQSRATSGSFRALTSSYTLTPVAAGMRLEYVGHVAPRFALFGPIEQAAVEQNISRQFTALAVEIERQSARAHAPSVGAAR